MNSLRLSVCLSVTELGSVTDRRQGPAQQKRERGWLAVMVASMGGLGTGESLQVLCGAQVCGTVRVSIKPGRWWSPISPRRFGSRAINQALCHGWIGTGPLCFRGYCRHRPRYPSSVVSFLSLCSSRREGAGMSRLRLTVSEGHGYPLVIIIIIILSLIMHYKCFIVIMEINVMF